MPLLICRTCPRYDRDAGAFGAQFDEVISGAARDRGIRVRHVACLGGCPDSGNVGLDATGKPRVRFSGITTDDADALLDAAVAFDASPTGNPGDWTVPAELERRLTAVSPKRIS